jgi:soluble lytic murein transglycosylase-like protein
MPKAPKFFFAALLLLSFSAAVAAQTGSKKAAVKAAPAVEAESDGDLARFRQDFIKASEGYKAGLQELITSLEEGLGKADGRHRQLVELCKDGLVARREVEESAKALAESRARIEEARREIANVETTIAAAKNPPPAPAANPDPTGALVAGGGPFWTTGNRSIDGLIRLYGGRYGVDPYLIYCVMRQESSFRAGAVSVKGATGLMQLMPGTAARYGVTNIYDPAQNIAGGTRYLRDLLRLFNGRVDLVLAGYNAGEGAVMKYGYRVPPYRETRDYVQRIGARYAEKSGVTLTTKTSARKPKGK